MPDPASGITCSNTPAGNGAFSQNVQRLGLYAQDSWRVSSHLTVNYGLRYQTTFGLFTASGKGQTANPSFPAMLTEWGYPARAPQDDRKQFAPRLGIVYSPGGSEKTVIRAGFGLFFNDLAQGGWAAAFQSVNANTVAPPSLIDPNYKTPYAIHMSAGLQHALDAHWTMSADFTHEQGNHGYRAYPYPDVNLFRSDNRSSYNALMLRLQGNVSQRFSLTAHYTLAKAQTWGCVLGELFDYVNGVCDPLNAFARGDYGPSGEDVRHRFVIAGTLYARGGFEVTTITQAESARPYTITTADGSGRIEVNGNLTALDVFRGTPYIQADLRVSRPIKIGERLQVNPFAEFFNLFNRNNPGANFVANIAALPGVVSPDGINVTGICNPNCGPVTSLKQLEIPGGGLGDFFGPGTTVGIPFAAQVGVRVSF
jgi:outer membrane receptor protein involved in Fe transport